MIAIAIASAALAIPVRSIPGGSGWRIEGDQDGARLGRALATADVNGDGFGDLVVGAPGYDDLWRDEGRVTIYLGSSSGMSPVPAWTRYGRQRGAGFGTVVASAGDVNGDGYEDVLVGASGFDKLVGAKQQFVGSLEGHERYATDEGRVQLFLGSAAGLANLPQRTLTGIELGERFGSAVAGAGDVDGDGFGDVLVGATGKSGGLGGIFLFRGTASGIGPLPSWIELGPQVDAGWGSVVGPAGDVNEDGFADFIASAPALDRNPVCGLLRVYAGSATGPGPVLSEIDRRIPELGPSLDWNQDGDVETLYLRHGTGCTSTALTAVSTSFATGITTTFSVGTAGHHAVAAGDWIGDGWTDLAVGDSDCEDGPFRGRVTQRVHEAGTTQLVFEVYPVFHGEQSGAGYGDVLAATDVDGDGADELFIAAPGQTEGEDGEGAVWLVPGWPIRWSVDETAYSGIPAQFYGFGTAPSASGDFNADGFDDLVTTTDGVAGFEVRHGSSSGLASSADYDLLYPPLGLLGCGGDYHSVSAGDVTGDGFDDVLVTIDEGFPDCHGGYLVLGTRCALYLGAATGLDPEPLQWFPDGDTVFARAEVVGDVNGDGYEDVLNLRTGDLQLFLGSDSGLSALPDQVLPEDPYGGRYFSRYRSLLPGDLDDDELTDVVVVSSSSLSIYHGDPSGLVLTSSQGFSPTTMGCLALEDSDGDGIDDLLVEVTPATPFLEVWLGSPSGFTESVQWWSAPIQSILLAVFDADGDGHQEFLLGGPMSDGTPRQRIHRGSAVELERAPHWWGMLEVFSQHLPEPADFDGDGLTDLAFYSFDTPTPSFRIFEIAP
jgi:hypothetical protein